MVGQSGYWAGAVARRRSRRVVLQGMLFGGASMTAFALLGCSSRSRRSGSTSRPAGSLSGAEMPVTGGTFTTYVPANPNSLDVVAQQYATTFPIASSVMSHLVRVKSSLDPATYANNDVESDLAVSFESPDALTWIAKLRPNARFHNVAPVSGRPVEAEDVKASFIHMLQPTNNFAAFLAMIDPKQIDVPAQDTVAFKLKYAYGPFPQTTASPGFIMPREGVSGEYDPTKTVIGSGPFVFDSYTPDVSFILKKNPDWFEAGRPYVDVVQSPIVPSVSQQEAQFVAGKLDHLNPPTADIDGIKRSKPGVTAIQASDPNVWIVFGHMDQPGPYRDPRVRQALSLALDRDTLGKAVLASAYTTFTVLPAKYGEWALKPDQLGTATSYYKYDPALAKKLVAESGAGDQLQKLVYVQNYYGYDKMAEAVNGMLTQVGFKTQLVPLDYQKDYTNGGKGVWFGNFPTDTIVLAVTGGGPTAESYLGSLLQPGNSFNPAKVDDADGQAMVTKMLSIRDTAERLKAAQDIQRYLAEKLYLVPVPAPVPQWLMQPRVKNYCYSGNTSAGTGTYSKLWIAK